MSPWTSTTVLQSLTIHEPVSEQCFSMASPHQATESLAYVEEVW